MCPVSVFHDESEGGGILSVREAQGPGVESQQHISREHRQGHVPQEFRRGKGAGFAELGNCPVSRPPPPEVRE